MKLNKKLAVIPALTVAAGLAVAGGYAAHGSTHVIIARTVTAKPALAKTTHLATPKPVHTTDAPAPTQAAALPTVSPDLNNDPGAVEPSQIGLSADGNGWLSGITWSSWAATSAEGSGSIRLDNGVPNMAQGIVANVSISIALSAPTAGGNPYFTAMTVTDSAGNINTYADTNGPSGGMLSVSSTLSNADVPPATPPTSAASNPAGTGAACTTITGLYPGGQPGHLNSQGGCVMDGQNGQS